MVVSWRLLLAGLVLAWPAWGDDSACVTCHPAETRSHEQTRMAHAMMSAGASAFGKNLPDQPLRESAHGYEVSYQLSPFGIVLVTALRHGDTATGQIEWVLGAGAQGQTPLVESGGKILESHVSYFPGLGRFGITVGQEGGASRNALAALGEVENARDVKKCVGCHATGVTETLQPVEPGVQCARCHEGAAEHALRGGPVGNPGKFTPVEQVRFCGTCHRDKPPVGDNELENVRFQPLRLSESACFRSGKLECTTCHVAHRDARRNDAAFYNGKCVTCHGGLPGQQFHADARQKGDCIGCHMPYVELHPALHFTDHKIRVVKAGDFPQDMMRTR